VALIRKINLNLAPRARDASEVAAISPLTFRAGLSFGLRIDVLGMHTVSGRDHQSVG
jgi:hypothetical protein